MNATLRVAVNVLAAKTIALVMINARATLRVAIKRKRQPKVAQEAAVAKSDKNIYNDPRISKHPPLTEKQVDKLSEEQLKRVPSTPNETNKPKNGRP